MRAERSSSAIQSLSMQPAILNAAAHAPRRRRLGSAAVTLWPVLLTAPFLIASLWVHAEVHQFTRLTDFAKLGRQFAAPFGLQTLATSPIGYDGQFYYYMARFPGWAPPGGFDFPALRNIRLLYPLLARLIALGQPALLPLALIAINVAAITATVALVTWIVRERGLPTWLALVPGLNAGQALALERDLADPLAIFWLALALAGVHKGKWTLAAAALALGLLTRESTLIFALCFAIPLVLERQWTRLATYAAIVFLPYAAAQALVHQWLGVWPYQESARINAFAALPFAGLQSAPTILLSILMVVFACVPALASIALGSTALPRAARTHDAVLLVAALAATLYGAALLFQPGVHWLDLWEPLRLAAPLCVLLPLLTTRDGDRKIARGMLALMLSSATLALVM